jgi:hypothetical protein
MFLVYGKYEFINFISRVKLSKVISVSYCIKLGYIALII